MALLKIFLLVVAVIFLFVVAVIIYFVSKFKKIATEYRSLVPYLPPYLAKVSVKAVNAHDFNHTEAARVDLEKHLQALVSAGFAKLGQFSGNDGRYLEFLTHPSGVVAVLTVFTERCLYEFYAVEKSNKINLLTQNPFFQDRESPQISLHVDKALTVDAAMSRLLDGNDFQTLGVRDFVNIYEKVQTFCTEQTLGLSPNENMVAAWAEVQGLEALNEEDWVSVMRHANTERDEALEELLKEKVRRQLRMNSDRWEGIFEDILMVHRGSDLAVIGDWFNDRKVERLVEQFSQQSGSPQQIINAVNKRLGSDKQLIKVMEIERPVRTHVYVKPVQRDSIGLQPAELVPGPGLKEFLYTAVTPKGEHVKSSFVGITVADVRMQLGRIGYTDIEVLSEVVMRGDSVDVDPEIFSREMIEAQYDTLLVTIRKIFLGNWIIWAPFVIWALNALYTGSPFGWGDYLSFLLVPASLCYTAYLTLPVILIDRCQEAQSWGQAKRARRYLTLLERIGGRKRLGDFAMDVEKAKVTAAHGQVNEAMALIENHKEHIEYHVYLISRAQVHDAARDSQGLIGEQVLLTQSVPDSSEYKVDLALSLLRYTGKVKEAEALLSGLRPQDCSTLFALGYYFSRGILEMKRNNLSLALSNLNKSLEGLDEYSNPLVEAMKAEVGGYMAVVLRDQGDREKADKIWRQVSPRLQALRAEHVLLLYAGHHMAA